ncbi:MAG: sugar phosphate isomerase/epimerase [Hyphomicrobiales bacterium]|nr:sugar phosphate isomerase/epimerase [Hyphomicrobiales bacterium]MCP5000055.1 sugar phosphate isomerase/epimerase [Hyphomicrobiales bacterium]
MKFALCNEVLRELPFKQQCAVAAGVGYRGIELAPFTLDDEPHLLSSGRRKEVRRIAEDAGVPIIGLHWLLISPKGLSITTSDPVQAAKTHDVIQRLIGLCADLGGSVLVHGSPAQRDPADADNPQAAWDNALTCLRAAGDAAHAAGLTYCIEPLAGRLTSFINTIDDAVRFLDEAGSKGLRTMLDTCAAAEMEPLPVADTIRTRWGEGYLAHIQLNDRNQRAPGQGNDNFGPILRALIDVGYTGPVSVEPFIYEPDGPTTAAAAAGYLKGLMEEIERETGTDG